MTTTNINTSHLKLPINPYLIQHQQPPPPTPPPPHHPHINDVYDQLQHQLPPQPPLRKIIKSRRDDFCEQFVGLLDNCTLSLNKPQTNTHQAETFHALSNFLPIFNNTPAPRKHTPNPYTPTLTQDQIKFRRVHKLMLDGRTQLAMNTILNSNTPPNPITKEDISKLQDLHPAATETITPIYTPTTAERNATPTILPRTVLYLIRKAENGKAAGRSTITWEILKLLIRKPEGRNSIVNFLNALANTSSPANIEFLSGNLTPVDKYKEGIYSGKRPLVVQEVLVTLFASSIAHQLKPLIQKVLGKSQRAYTVNGTHLAFLNVKQQLGHSADNVLKRLDTMNAFNSSHRTSLLDAVRRFLPELYTTIYFLYSLPTKLYLNNVLLAYSYCGTRQGEALASIGYCLTTLDAVQSPKLNPTTDQSAYADDVMIVQNKSHGDTEVNDYATKIKILNLDLQTSKTETVDPSAPTFITSIFGSYLGDPLSVHKKIQDSVNVFLQTIATLRRLYSIHPSDALILLTRSWHPTVNSFLLRNTLTTSQLDQLNNSAISTLLHFLKDPRITFPMVMRKPTDSGLSFTPFFNTRSLNELKLTETLQHENPNTPIIPNLRKLQQLIHKLPEPTPLIPDPLPTQLYKAQEPALTPFFEAAASICGTGTIIPFAQLREAILIQLGLRCTPNIDSHIAKSFTRPITRALNLLSISIKLLPPNTINPHTIINALKSQMPPQTLRLIFPSIIIAISDASLAQHLSARPPPTPFRPLPYPPTFTNVNLPQPPTPLNPYKNNNTTNNTLPTTNIFPPTNTHPTTNTSNTTTNTSNNTTNNNSNNLLLSIIPNNSNKRTRTQHNESSKRTGYNTTSPQTNINALTVYLENSDQDSLNSTSTYRRKTYKDHSDSDSTTSSLSSNSDDDIDDNPFPSDNPPPPNFTANCSPNLSPETQTVSTDNIESKSNNNNYNNKKQQFNYQTNNSQLSECVNSPPYETNPKKIEKQNKKRERKRESKRESRSESSSDSKSENSGDESTDVEF